MLSAREKFTRLVEEDHPEPSLAEVSLLVAAEEYEDLDVEACLARFDRLAIRVERVGNRLGVESIEALRIVLAEEQGFHGNLDDYYDTRNSFLNEVLDRRAGIPITLSVLYVEVARRLGLKADGVGFPGHFLVRIEQAAETRILDPFHGGTSLTLDDCAGLLARITGSQIPFHARLLQPTPWRDIVYRLLANLKNIYLSEPQDFRRGLAVLDRMLLVRPDSLAEVRDRGLVRYRMENYREATADLERFVHAAEHEDSHLPREQVEAIKRLLRKR